MAAVAAGRARRRRRSAGYGASDLEHCRAAAGAGGGDYFGRLAAAPDRAALLGLPCRRDVRLVRSCVRRLGRWVASGTALERLVGNGGRPGDPPLLLERLLERRRDAANRFLPLSEGGEGGARPTAADGYLLWTVVAPWARAASGTTAWANATPRVVAWMDAVSGKPAAQLRPPSNKTAEPRPPLRMDDAPGKPAAEPRPRNKTAEPRPPLRPAAADDDATTNAALLGAVLSDVRHAVDLCRLPGAVLDAPSQAAVDASFRAVAAGAVPADRAARKVLQIAPLIEHAAAHLRPGGTCADLCGGAGHVALAMAVFRPDVRVVVVDTKSFSLAMGRTAALGLGMGDRARFVRGSMESESLPAFDVGIALHACGGASDAALACCARAGADAFLIVTCCHGFLAREVRPPRSAAYRALGVSARGMAVLARAADRPPGAAGRREGMEAVDADRCLAAQESGVYASVRLGRLGEGEASGGPKDHVLVGVRGPGGTS